MPPLRPRNARFHSASLIPVAIRRPLTPEQQAATATQGIPAEWHFSDHVPVGGVFRFHGGPCEPCLA